MKERTFIGVMTGNSMDAADAVWIRFTDDNVSLLSTARMEMPHALAAQLIDLTDKGGSADDFMEAQNAVTQLCSNAVLQLNADWATVDAIGCHGQTLCHNPVRGYSWQLLNGALLAELVGIDTVCDFRSRDIAAPAAKAHRWRPRFIVMLFPDTPLAPWSISAASPILRYWMIPAVSLVLTPDPETC